MLPKNPWGGILSRLRTELRKGAGWFFLSSLLAPLISLLMGPLILRKIGLEEYAVLALGGYFFSFVTVYYDMGTYPHLLSVFSKRDSGRFLDFGNAMVLRSIMLLGFFGTLALWSLMHPRPDALYAYLAVSMIGLALPSPNLDWYFIAKRRYFDFFRMKLIFSIGPLVLILAWFFSRREGIVWIAAINVVSAGAASAYAIHVLGFGRVRDGVSCLLRTSWRGAFGLVFKVFPLAMTQLLTPYFLAYSLIWFSRVVTEKEIVGAFGISYRVAIGFSALLAPLSLYIISRSQGSVRSIRLRRLLGPSLLLTAGFGIIGIGVITLYFRASGVNPALYAYTVETFSILLIAIFFVCLRTVYVSRSAAEGRYKAYFVIHLLACLPTLTLSMWSQIDVLPRWIPWLSCLPDAFATAGFITYFYLFHDRPGRGMRRTS